MNNISLVRSERFGNVYCDFYQNENGEVLMTREQIGKALEYAHPNDAIRNIHDRYKDRIDGFSVSLKLSGTDGKLYDTYAYNSKGVYEICRWSRQPKADQFMDWVWDVIESVRKTGEYKKPDSYTIEDPVARAERWIEEQREKQFLLQKIESDKPLVTFAETALKSNDNILVRELAKVMCDQGIEVGEKRLYKWLRTKKLVMSGSTEPYQSALDMGLFVREEKPVKTAYGERLVFTTKVTPKGQVYIVEKYREELQKLPANVSPKVSA